MWHIWKVKLEYEGRVGNTEEIEYLVLTAEHDAIDAMAKGILIIDESPNVQRRIIGLRYIGLGYQ